MDDMPETLHARIKAAYARADATGTDGHTWLDAFEKAAHHLGLVHGSSPCVCPDSGDYGHLPECGLEVGELEED